MIIPKSNFKGSENRHMETFKTYKNNYLFKTYGNNYL